MHSGVLPSRSFTRPGGATLPESELWRLLGSISAGGGVPQGLHGGAVVPSGSLLSQSMLAVNVARAATLP